MQKAVFAFLLFIILGLVIRLTSQLVHHFDTWIQVRLRGDLPSFATAFFTRITSLGNTSVILMTSLVVAIFLWFKQWRDEVKFLLANLVGMMIASTLFKIIFDRARPDLLYLIEKPIGASFPSWHAASTFIIYVSFAVIIRRLIKNRYLCVTLQVILVLLALSVALSRIYVGVHYPTDIVGGWLLGLALLYLNEVLFLKETSD